MHRKHNHMIPLVGLSLHPLFHRFSMLLIAEPSCHSVTLRLPPTPDSSSGFWIVLISLTRCIRHLIDTACFSCCAVVTLEAIWRGECQMYLRAANKREIIWVQVQKKLTYKGTASAQAQQSLNSVRKRIAVLVSCCASSTVSHIVRTSLKHGTASLRHILHALF